MNVFFHYELMNELRIRMSRKEMSICVRNCIFLENLNSKCTDVNNYSMTETIKFSN